LGEANPDTQSGSTAVHVTEQTNSLVCDMPPRLLANFVL